MVVKPSHLQVKTNVARLQRRKCSDKRKPSNLWKENGSGGQTNREQSTNMCKQKSKAIKPEKTNKKPHHKRTRLAPAEILVFHC